jgi:hypothetical protein
MHEAIYSKEEKEEEKKLCICARGRKTRGSYTCTTHCDRD